MNVEIILSSIYNSNLFNVSLKFKDYSGPRKLFDSLEDLTSSNYMLMMHISCKIHLKHEAFRHI